MSSFFKSIFFIWNKCFICLSWFGGHRRNWRPLCLRGNERKPLGER